MSSYVNFCNVSAADEARNIDDHDDGLNMLPDVSTDIIPVGIISPEEQEANEVSFSHKMAEVARIRAVRMRSVKRISVLVEDFAAPLRANVANLTNVVDVFDSYQKDGYQYVSTRGGVFPSFVSSRLLEKEKNLRGDSIPNGIDKLDALILQASGALEATSATVSKLAKAAIDAVAGILANPLFDVRDSRYELLTYRWKPQFENISDYAFADHYNEAGLQEMYDFTKEITADARYADPELLSGGTIKLPDRQLFDRNQDDIIARLSVSTAFTQDDSLSQEDVDSRWLSQTDANGRPLYVAQARNQCVNCRRVKTGCRFHIFRAKEDGSEVDPKNDPSICPRRCRMCHVFHDDFGFGCKVLSRTFAIEQTLPYLKAALLHEVRDGDAMIPANPVIYLCAPTGTGKSTKTLADILNNVLPASDTMICLTPTRTASSKCYEFESVTLNFPKDRYVRYLREYRTMEMFYIRLSKCVVHMGVYSSNDVPRNRHLIQQLKTDLLRYRESIAAFAERQRAFANMAYTCAFVHGSRATGQRTNSSPNYMPGRNKLVYTTDGYAAEHCHLLGTFDLIVFDECYALSVNKELVAYVVRKLMLEQQKARARRLQHPRSERVREQRILVMSATLLANPHVPEDDCVFSKMVKFFEPMLPRNVDQILVDFGRLESNRPQFQVTAFFSNDDSLLLAEQYKREDLYECILNALAMIASRSFGEASTTADQLLEQKYGVLVFVARKEECEYIAGRLRQELQIVAAPYYSGITNVHHRDLVFHPDKGQLQRVIISTNVAENAVTVPHIGFVIDSGRVIRNSFNRSHNCQCYNLERISQSERIQRFGRVGRQFHGIVVCLYSKRSADDAPIDIMSEVQLIDKRILYVRLYKTQLRLTHAYYIPIAQQLFDPYEQKLPSGIERKDTEDALIDLVQLSLGSVSGDRLRLAHHAIETIGWMGYSPELALLFKWLNRLVKTTDAEVRKLARNLYILARKIALSRNLFGEQIHSVPGMSRVLSVQRIMLPREEEDSINEEDLKGQQGTKYGDLAVAMMLIEKLFNNPALPILAFLSKCRIDRERRAALLSRYGVYQSELWQIINEWQCETGLQLPSFCDMVFGPSGYRRFDYKVVEIQRLGAIRIDFAVLEMSRQFYRNVLMATATPIGAGTGNSYRLTYRGVADVNSNPSVEVDGATLPNYSALYSIAYDEDLEDDQQPGVYMYFEHLCFESFAQYNSSNVIQLAMETPTHGFSTATITRLSG